MLDDEFDNLPDEMRNAKRWLLWKLESNPDPTKKSRKVPYYASGCKRSGQLDTQADLSMLSSFDGALFALHSGDYTGLGFALGADGTGKVWQGIDFDNMSKHPELAYVADDLPGYTEQSPSGDGLHAIGYGRPFTSLGSNTTGIEAYSSGRYFTVTADGSGIHPPTCLADFVEKRLKPMHGSKTDASPTDEPGQCETVSSQTITELRSALLFMRADDRELWQKNGHRLKGLGEVGRGLWLEWCATSDKFDPQADSKSWESFKPTRTGYKAIFKVAQSQGWVNPASTSEKTNQTSATGNLLKFKLLSADDLCNLPPMRWFVRGVLPAEGIAALYGPSGSGKSFLTLDLAEALADADYEWFDHRVTQCPVTYVCLEGEAGMGKRVKARSLHYKKPVPDGLKFITQPFDLLSNDVGELAKTVLAGGCAGGVTILDTLNRAAPGADENSSVDMGNLIAAAKELQILIGGLVLLVHHTGKDVTKGLRGHSSLYAALDGAIEVSMNNGRREWSVAKSKDDVTGEAHPFKLEIVSVGFDDDGEEITSCVACSIESIDNEFKRVLPPKSGNQKIIWDALQSLLKKTDSNQAEGVQGVKKIKLDYAIDKTRGRLVCDARRQTERTQAAISGLVARGLLKFQDDWLWIA